MRFNRPVTGPRLGLIADALDGASKGQGEPDERAIAAVEHMLADLGVPARLRDVGVESDVLSAIVEAAIDDWSITRVPRTVQRQDLADLLEAAW
jgi:alcohol dehydrogenase class IV